MNVCMYVCILFCVVQRSSTEGLCNQNNCRIVECVTYVDMYKGKNPKRHIWVGSKICRLHTSKKVTRNKSQAKKLQFTSHYQKRYNLQVTSTYLCMYILLVASKS
jgi:hypothetical protein